MPLLICALGFTGVSGCEFINSSVEVVNLVKDCF